MEEIDASLIYGMLPVSVIHVHSVYIDSNGEIESFETIDYLLQQHGVLQKQELANIIRSKMVKDKEKKQVKYSVLDILKFAMTVQSHELNEFASTSLNSSSFSRFFNMETIRGIQPIVFDATLDIFHDFNDVFILFYDKPVLAQQSANAKAELQNTRRKTKRKILQFIVGKLRNKTESKRKKTKE